MKKLYKPIVLCIVLIIAASQYSFAANYLPIGNYAYEIFNRLEAEGVIKSGLLDTKPISIDEAIRLYDEAKLNSKKSSLFTKELVKDLKKELSEYQGDVNFIKPVKNIYTRITYKNSGNGISDYNNNGRTYRKGANLTVGLSSEARYKRFSIYLNPELRLQSSSDRPVLNEGYAVFNFAGTDFSYGKMQRWWGPGYNGSLLLSNNPEALTAVGISNPMPTLLPGFLSHLGLFKATFFVSKLGSNRVVSKPYLWGLRLDFKPAPFLEIGVERTALLGGKGRSSKLKTWIKSFTGRGENISGVEAGDQIAGGDIKITLPFKFQPIQLYLEGDGEDQAGIMPSHWAYVTGLYLPRILGFEHFSYRIEFAETSEVWYVHHIYKTGYSYKGRIIGHYMGTDSTDLFSQISYMLPKYSGKISLFFDMQRYGLHRARPREDNKQIGVKSQFNTPFIMKNSYVMSGYSHTDIKNEGGSLQNGKIDEAYFQFGYRF